MNLNGYGFVLPDMIGGESDVNSMRLAISISLPAHNRQRLQQQPAEQGNFREVAAGECVHAEPSILLRSLDL
jgi:hypothetical protein